MVSAKDGGDTGGGDPNTLWVVEWAAAKEDMLALAVTTKDAPGSLDVSPVATAPLSVP